MRHCAGNVAAACGRHPGMGGRYLFQCAHLGDLEVMELAVPGRSDITDTYYMAGGLAGTVETLEGLRGKWFNWFEERMVAGDAPRAGHWVDGGPVMGYEFWCAAVVGASHNG